MNFVLGRENTYGFLVNPDRGLFTHHCSIEGVPGSAKTMLMLSMIVQSIRQPDPTLNLLASFDAKGSHGDPIIRNWLAENTPADVPFYYLSTDENEESDHYDALAAVTRLKDVGSRSNLLCARLGFSPTLTKEKFFFHVNDELSRRAFEWIERKDIKLTSFDELLDILKATRDKAGHELEHATDIINRVHAVSRCSRLVPKSGKKLIVPDRLFEQPSVLCVNLPVMEGSQQAQHVGRWLMSDLILSARRRRGLLFCDEAHHIFDTRETLLVAEQGRGFGVSIIMAAQSRDQYQTEDGRPLGWAVGKLCRVKVQFSPNTREELGSLMVQSGLKDIERTSHTISNRPNAPGVVPVITESITTFADKETKLGLNDLLGHFKDVNCFVLQIDHGGDYAYPTLVKGVWPLTVTEYERLKNKPWPAPKEPEPAPTPAIPVKEEKPKTEVLKALEAATIKTPKPTRRKKKQKAQKAK